MEMTIKDYRIKIRKVHQTKNVSVDIAGQKILYLVEGSKATLLEGSVPEEVKATLEKTLGLYFRTKI